MRWYSEYLAGHDLPEFSQAMMRALDRHLDKAASKKLDQPVPTATDGGDIEAAAPVDKGLVLKKKALIDKHCSQWPTMERDFQDANTNQLSKMAKAPSHGHWFEAAALAWAEQRGKLTKVGQHAAPASPFTGMVHKINR